ncbi:hypothetical protein [Gemmatimonas groenlandica]|uniref:Uncharacterized protein n=1 Tax=Gemmatimonas groenlandica TaxID=2732249 RepID=A0A6M4IVT1_9BACT|nr:hypothetical protein [Gemmatimonas groenlandica]QJR37829.1 hypothetical protein HKW67_21030 [Gemmatimonas groenlandica]
MDVRRRIAALALFGVQLLQGVLPATGADCERAVVSKKTVGVAAPADLHRHHVSAVSEASSAAPVANEHAADPAPQPVPVQHSHAPAACPMAMACTVVGVMSAAVAVNTVDVAVDVHRPVHVTDWPVSLDIAPEPPPPRG